MPTINVPIAVGADDGFVDYTIGGRLQLSYYSHTYLAAGGSHFGSFFMALRFQAINIAQGATITSATLQMVKNTVRGTPSVKIYGNNVDNAPAWGASNRVKNISKTAQSALLDVTNATSSTNVTTILQAIVNRAGWAANNAMAFGGFNNAGHAGTNFWEGFAFEKGGTDIPSLSVTYTSGGGTTYNDTISGSVTAVDTEAAALTANATISGSIASSDSLTTTATARPTISDSVTGGDSVTATATVNPTASDSTAAADSIAAAATLITSLFESVTAADAINGGLVLTGTITDSATAADRNTIVVTANATVSGSGTTADSLSAAATYNPSISSSVAGTDSIAALATFNASLSDSTTAADSNTGGLLLNSTITDSIIAADQNTITLTANAAVSDATSASDSVSASATFVPALSDAATATDALPAAAMLNNSLSDTVAATDAVVTDGITYDDTISDALTAIDGIQETLVSGQSQSLGSWPVHHKKHEDEPRYHVRREYIDNTPRDVEPEPEIIESVSSEPQPAAPDPRDLARQAVISRLTAELQATQERQRIEEIRRELAKLEAQRIKADRERTAKENRARDEEEAFFMLLAA